MPATATDNMLDVSDLRRIDRQLLDRLQAGRVTPVYCQRDLLASGDRDDVSRQYVQQRLARLVEHDHARNLHGCGLYELMDDPRDGENA